MLLLGDCNDHLKQINDNSIDLLVTDPPYGLEFMGKDWDKVVVPTDTWNECYRVLKQGKLAFIMCSPRQDVLARMIVNLQDVGFRTNYSSIYWTYASGFPKAANLSKLIDKKNGRDFNPEFREYLNTQRIKKNLTFNNINEYLGYSTKGGNFTSDLLGNKKDNRYLLPDVETYSKLKTLLELDNRFDEFIAIEEAEREIIGKRTDGRYKSKFNPEVHKSAGFGAAGDVDKIGLITKPATEEAKKMEGAYVGFQPKPAVEVILVVSKGKTLTWLDDCRIPYQSSEDQNSAEYGAKQGLHSWNEMKVREGDRKETVLGKSKAFFFEDSTVNEKGRFPANLLVEDDVLNDGSIHKSGKFEDHHIVDSNERNSYGQFKGQNNKVSYGDIGSYSRYFSLDSWAEKTLPFLICPKASKAERNKGVETLEPVKVNDGRQTPIDNPFQRGETLRTNSHPTVKPLKLMSYLITMGSRQGDLVLDPFCGSGTVLIAADQLHRKWLGIERNPEYAEIIKKRLMVPLSQLKLTVFE